MVEVGQELYYMPSDNQRSGLAGSDDGHYVTVSKVGRKWAALDSWHSRIHKDELWADGDGYASPGHCYLSRDHYLDSVQAKKDYRELSTVLGSYAINKKFTRDQIDAARLALELPVYDRLT